MVIQSCVDSIVVLLLLLLFLFMHTGWNKPSAKRSVRTETTSIGSTTETPYYSLYSHTKHFTNSPWHQGKRRKHMWMLSASRRREAAGGTIKLNGWKPPPSATAWEWSWRIWCLWAFPRQGYAEGRPRHAKAGNNAHNEAFTHYLINVAASTRDSSL